MLAKLRGEDPPEPEAPAAPAATEGWDDAYGSDAVANSTAEPATDYFDSADEPDDEDAWNLTGR